MKPQRASRRPAGAGDSLAPCSWRPQTTASPAIVTPYRTARTELEQRQEACEVILGRMREEATRPGRTLADAFADCRRFYAEAEFPDEWMLHHQGGMTGYASREIIATPQTHQEIRVGQAFAWNPSVTGAKAEETFVLSEGGPEVIT